MTIAILTIALFPAQPAEVAPVGESSAVEASAETPIAGENPDGEEESDFEAKLERKLLRFVDEDGEGNISVHIEGDHDDDIDEKLLERLTPEQLSEWLLAREARKAADDNAPPMVATLVPLFFFISLAFLVGYPIYLRYRKHGQVQETLRLMVEKGTPIPAELLEPSTPRRNDTRRGLILVTLGLGLGLCLLLIDGTDGAWGIGIIPLFVGMGYIVAGRVDRNDNGGPQA